MCFEQHVLKEYSTGAGIVVPLQKLAQECLRLANIAALEPQPLPDGSGWQIKVTWSDGRVELIGTFGSETTARDWIHWDAPKFFRDQSAKRAAEIKSAN